MASGIICQSCGIEAPTRLVDFHQNIGMLVMRTRRRMNGMLCKRCIHKHFWKMTGTTLVLGPWGTISAIVAPCFIINNVVRYLGVLAMPAVPPDAKVPTLDVEAIAKVHPFAQVLTQRLSAKEPLAVVATDIAHQARVTPGQVVKYAMTMFTTKLPAIPQPPTGGFPVLPAQPAPVLPIPQAESAEIELIELAQSPAGDGSPGIGLTD